MTLPASITTNLFPDFKNSPIGPFARIVQEAQDTDNSTFELVGSSAANVKKAQSFQVSASGELVSVDLRLAKGIGSPTDNLIIELCADNGGNPGSVLATGVLVAATPMTTTPKYFRSTFFTPYTLQTSTAYWIVLSRSGGLDALNSVGWWKNSTAPYANGSIKTFNGSTWSSATGDARFKLNIRTSGRYQPCVDKTNNKVRMFKSTDGGNTWNEQDSADAPAIATTSNLKSFSAVQVDTFINVCRVTDANGFVIFRYNTGTDQWETTSHADSPTMPVNTSVAGVAPMLMTFKPLEANWDYVVACNGQTETVMGNARRRVKIKRRNSGGGWPVTPGYDLVGSPNTPDVTTLPGNAVDYDLRAAIMDGNGTWHGWWTRSDDSNLYHRQYNENNTFSTANLMGSTAAVTSNSAAYSVGQPTNYYRNGEWYIAIPYVDSGVLKVSRVKAADAATAANWTNTSVITATIETTNSNPAVLVADNEQGGKLFLIYTKSDGKLYYTHDQANDNWVAEQELHPGTKTVGAISGGVMVDAIGLCYLDTAPATDDLKFDSL